MTEDEQLMELLADTEGAAEILGELAGALFGGMPSIDQLTWDEATMGTDAPKKDASPAERLRLAERRYRHLVEQIPAITFMAVLGEGENEVAVSPHIERVLGFKAEEWLANPFLWYQQLHPDDREMWHDEFARGCRTGGPWSGECRYFARDGSIKWIRGEAHLIRDERGRPQVLQGVAYDVTDARRAQEILVERAVSDAKTEEDLAIARRVQRSVLPRVLEAEGLVAAAMMRPADNVGGDYYDFRAVDDGAWIAIGDVSGHGIDAGLLMLMTQSAVSALLQAMPLASPADIIVHLNETLHHNVRERLQQDDHVTFSLLRFYSEGFVQFAGAHEDLLVYRRDTGRLEQIATSGTWLGGRGDLRGVTRDSALTLRDGDVLLLHTDGLTEAMNDKREMFGIERVGRLLVEHGQREPAQIIEAIMVELDGWMHTQADDISMLVARYCDV